MRAALYLRSSKDRSDVSIAAQRRELEALAADRGLIVAQVFEDVVESAKTEHRPAFLDLSRSIRNPGRGWSTILVLDHSRIARNRLVASAFKLECRKAGVDVIYAYMPETDPVSAVLLESMHEAIAEVHSLMSRDKGLAGMAENVRQGWRAGGRAPLGYRLEHEPTGAIRDGKPVMKSRLVPSSDAAAVRRYLKSRVMGEPRATLVRDLPWTATTMVGVEWNALTYAGHTVWNRHAPKSERGKGKPRKRPRDEWLIERNTHEPLITDAEAEVLLSMLENSDIGKAVSRAKAGMSDYLLTGLLESPDGRKWIGYGGDRYRLKPATGRPGKHIRAEPVDMAVLAQITADMRSEAFVEAMSEAARKAGLADDPGKPIRAEIDKLEREKGRAAKLALEVDDGGTFAGLVEERSRQIAALKRELEAVEEDSAIREAMASLTPAKVRELMLELGSPRAVLASLVDRITLTPEGECRIYYRSVLSMASPGGFARWDAVESDTCVSL